MSQLIEQSVEVIEGLLKFQYRHIGYGKLACKSCGAYAYLNDEGEISNVENCSRSCPWEKAREYIHNAKKSNNST